MEATHPWHTLGELLDPQDRTDCALAPNDPRLRLRVGGVAFDARRVAPGDLFVAYAGQSHDGHDFAHQAVAAGATAVLCASPISDLPVPQLVHPDPRALMGRVAQALHHDPAGKLRVVAITGTNGKTTTAHLVASMVATAWGSAGLLGTLGASVVAFDAKLGIRVAPLGDGLGLTTPEAPDLLAVLARMVAQGVPAVVLEASSIALVTGRLRQVPCDVAVLTNITQDHLDYHGTMQAYRAAKAELFHQGRKPAGTSIWPWALAQTGTEPWTQTPIDGALCTYDAQSDPAHPSSADIALQADGGPKAGPAGALAVRTPRGLLQVTSPLFGSFNDENVLAAVAVGEALQLPHEAMAQGVAKMAPVPGRLERVAVHGGAQRPRVLVDFAHTPDAVARVIAAVRDRATGRVIVVVGCGGDRDRAKRPLMGLAAAAADAVWLTSDNPRSEHPADIAQAMLEGLLRAPHLCEWHVTLDRAHAIVEAVRSARADDVVLLLGKGHENYQLVAGHKLPFDDRNHARQALAAWAPGEPTL